MELQEGQQTTPRHCGGRGSPTERNDTTATEESEVNHSDIFRLRSSIVEIVEDLKLRQAVEKENEERINQLLSEKHELERQLESEKLNQHAAEEKRQQEAIHNKQQCDDKIRTLEEEQKQFQILKNCAEKEMKTMKEEARALQLCKYRLDKRVKELEARLGTQERRWDTQHGQLTGLENKVAAVRKHFHRLEGSQSRLDKNVEEAVKLNRTLMSVNKHQHCVISQLRQDAASLRSHLVEARAAAQQAAGGGPHTLQERDQLNRLKVKVSTLEMEKTSIQRELDFCQEHLQATVSNLQTAEGLLQQHQQDGAHHLEQLQDLQLQVQQLQQQCQALRSRHQAATLELEEARAAGEEHEACWREKVQTAERERAAVAEQLTNTHSTLTGMEQEADRLNSRLQDTARKLAEAQALLNVERVSGLTQTDISLFLTSSASVQTEVRQVSVCSQMSPMTSAVAVQTLMELQHASCQTPAVVTSSSHSQTYVAPVLSQSAQTWQAALSVVGTQTDLPADSPETARHASELKTTHQHRRPQLNGQAHNPSSPSSSAGLAAVTAPPTTAITSPPTTAITPRVSPAESSSGVTPVTSQAVRAAGEVAVGGVSDQVSSGVAVGGVSDQVCSGVAVGGVSDQVCSGVAVGGVSDQVCSGVAVGGVSDQVCSGVAVGGVSDQVCSGVAAVLGQSLVRGGGTEERRRGGGAETCPGGALREQLSSGGAERRRLPTVTAPHRRQSASRVAQQRQSASDTARGSQPTSLFTQEGRSTTTGHEGQSTTTTQGSQPTSLVAQEGRSTTIGHEGQSATIAQEGQSTTIAYEGQSTTIAYEGQSTTIAQEGKSTTIAQEGQSTTTARGSQPASLVAHEGQSTTIAHEAQSTTTAHDGRSTTIAQEGESASVSIAERGPQASLSVEGGQPPSATVATSAGDAAVPLQSGGPVSAGRTDSRRKGARPPPTEGALHCPPAGLSSVDDVILSPSESARHVGSVTTTQSAVAPVSDVSDEPPARPPAVAGLAAGSAGRGRPGRPPSVRAPPSLCVPASWACLQPVVTLTDVARNAHHPPLGKATPGARRPGVDGAALCSTGARNGPSGANGPSADTGSAGQRGQGGVPDVGCKSTVGQPPSFSSVLSSSSSSSSSSAPLDPAASPAVGRWTGSRSLSLSLSLSRHSESRSGRSGGKPQGAEKLASVSASSSSSSCTSSNIAASSSSAGRGVLTTAVSSTLSSSAAAWTVRSLGTKSRPMSRTTRPQSKYPMLQMSILPDRDDPKTPKTRKGILKGFQYTDNVKDKTVTFAPMKAKKTAEPVSSDVVPPSPSPGVMTADDSGDDQSLFSDADDNGTQDDTTSDIRRQCRRIVGLLEEHRDVTSTFSSRKRKLQD